MHVSNPYTQSSFKLRIRVAMQNVQLNYCLFLIIYHRSFAKKNARNINVKCEYDWLSLEIELKMVISQRDDEREEKKILRLALKLNRSINRAVIVMYV